jgi:hypothetical protein
MGFSRNATVGSQTVVNSGDVLGAIRFSGSDGTNFVRAAQIAGVVDGTPGTNDMPGRLIFSTSADGSATPTERMRITSDGYLRMASGTGGIQFNGDTAAANALDDYEEGTFTPTIIGTTTAGTGTYSSQVGRYTKIGNRVYFSVAITWSAHTGTGNMKISGLPFTSVNTASGFNFLAVGANNLTYTSQLTAFVDVNATTASMATFASAGALTSLAIDTAATVYVSGHYEV